MKKFCGRCKTKTRHIRIKSRIVVWLEIIFDLDEQYEPQNQCTVCGRQA